MGVMATLKGIGLLRKGLGTVFNKLGVPDSVPFGPVDLLTGGRQNTDKLLDTVTNPASLLKKDEGGPKP